MALETGGLLNPSVCRSIASSFLRQENKTPGKQTKKPFRLHRKTDKEGRPRTLSAVPSQLKCFFFHPDHSATKTISTGPPQASRVQAVHSRWSHFWLRRVCAVGRGRSIMDRDRIQTPRISNGCSVIRHRLIKMRFSSVGASGHEPNRGGTSSALGDWFDFILCSQTAGLLWLFGRSKSIQGTAGCWFVTRPHQWTLPVRAPQFRSSPRRELRSSWTSNYILSNA